MKPISSRSKLPAQSERAFFYFLTTVFIGVFIQVVVTNPAVRQPLRLLTLVVLLSLHIFFHWHVGRMEDRPGGKLAYVIGQGFLAFIVCALAGSLGMIFGLYMALIGEVTGLFNRQRSRMVVAIGFYILLSLSSYGLLFGWNTIQWWALAILPMTLFVYIYVSLYTQQTVARERAQALLVELEAANQQLTEYAATVEDLTIAAERQRMARELHDTLSQGLAGLILQLEAVDAHLTNGRSERAQTIVEKAMLQARLTLAEARRAIDDLRTGTSQQRGSAGLEEALRQEAENFHNATGIPCDVTIFLPKYLPGQLLEPTCKAVQEGLANIARHAHARHASLRLAVEQTELVLEVRDDGCGFEPPAAENQPGHYGLLGMRERARLAGGSLEISSAPGQGSQIVMRLPLQAVKADAAVVASAVASASIGREGSSSK